MDMNFANRLCELRKSHNMSQEELADKLNVSRQAISKWETGSASPDTNNLIMLSKIYGITLDELVTGNKVDSIDSNKTINPDDIDTSQSIHFGKNGLDVTDRDSKVHIGKDGISVIDNDESVTINKDTIKVYTKNNKGNIVSYSVISGLTTILSVIAYILMGLYLPRGWEVTWPVFLLIPIVSSIISCINDRKISNFAFPVLVAGIYCIVGQVCGLWHPSWVLFLGIPLFYTIAKPLDKLINPKGIKKDAVEFNVEAEKENHD